MAPEFKRQTQGAARPATESYEKRDARPGWIFGIVIGLFVGLVSAQAFLRGTIQALGRKAPPQDQMTGARREALVSSNHASFPRLQISAPEDLKEFCAREAAELNSYGWLDKTAGVVRIPLHRAMELALQRGLPVRADPNHSRLGPTPFELQQQRTNSSQAETTLPR